MYLSLAEETSLFVAQQKIIEWIMDNIVPYIQHVPGIAICYKHHDSDFFKRFSFGVCAYQAKWGLYKKRCHIGFGRYLDDGTCNTPFNIEDDICVLKGIVDDWDSIEAYLIQKTTELSERKFKPKYLMPKYEPLDVAKKTETEVETAEDKTETVETKEQEENKGVTTMDNTAKATETATFPRMNITICIDFGNGMKVSQPVDVTVNQQPVTAAPPSAETTETAEEQRPIEAAPVAAIETENETADENPQTEEEKEPTPAELEDALPENRPPVKLKQPAKLHLSFMQFGDGIRVKYSNSRKTKYYISAVDIYRSFVGANVAVSNSYNPLSISRAAGRTFEDRVRVLKNKIQKLVDEYWPGVKVESVTRYGKDGTAYVA